MAIEIVDFPIKNGRSFHSCVTVYQRVYPSKDSMVYSSSEKKQHVVAEVEIHGRAKYIGSRNFAVTTACFRRFRSLSIAFIHMYIVYICIYSMHVNIYTGLSNGGVLGGAIRF